MREKRTNPDFLNGVPEMLLLSLLVRQPMYGYELVQAIHRSTDGTLEFGEGCVYPTLHRLEAEGLLESSRQTVGGRNRVVYCVTAKGSARLAGSMASWQKIVASVHNVLALNGGVHGEPAVA